jgi:hypothetical protein
LAGPVVDDAEQVTMDRAEMGEVVVAKIQALMEQDDLSGCREPRFACARARGSVIPSRFLSVPVRGST